MEKIKHFIKIWDKNYFYTIEEVDSKVSKIYCPSAKIEQEFLNEDILYLLKDLPNLIKSEEKYKEKKDSVVRFRISWMEKVRLQKKVKESWYSTVSAFIKDKVFN